MTLASKALSLGVLFAAAAAANSLTITVSGTGSGHLGNAAFNNAAFTFTLTTDTTRRIKPPCCPTTDTQQSTPTTFTIAGAGSGTFTDNQVVFAFPGQSVVGFAHYNDGDLVDLTNPAFAGYDMSTSLGPITGAPSFIGACPSVDCTTFATSAGALTFSDISRVTFNFVVAAAQAAPSTTTLTSSSGASVFGQPVVLTATVSPAAATGGVTFYDGVAIVGSASLAAGKATLTTALLPSGPHSLKAFYRGDSNYLPSTSAALSQNVQAAAQSGFQTASVVSGLIHPRTIAVADFNGDGRADLAVNNFDINSVAVLLGNGDGTFKTPVSYATQQLPFTVVAADFNGDGRMDLVVSNAAGPSSSVSVLLGNGDGTFQTAVSYPAGANPSRIAVGDFNGDGVPDIVTSNFGDNTLSVLLGKGDGTFRAASTFAAATGPGFIAVGDFNGDGRADLVLSNSSKNVSVLLGNGDGTFQAAAGYAAGTTPQFIAVADLNGDGRADLALANLGDDTISVLLGNGNGTFQAAVNYSAPKNPQSVAVADVNGDGRPDLVVADAGNDGVSVLLGNGDGTFQTAVPYASGAGPVFVAAGDFNGDGRTDLAVANFNVSTLGILLGAAPVAPPPTAPSLAGVVNGASFENTGLSPGLIFTLTGVRLGPDTGVTAQLDANGRIAALVSDTQVLVDGTPAPLLFVRQDQINAVVPYAVANKVGQTVKVQVIYKGNAGNLVSVLIVATAPAIFPFGGTQGAIRNQDQSVNGTGNGAASGSFVSIYATGEGQTNPPGIDGQLVTDSNTHPAANVTVTISGAPAVVQFQGSTVFDGFIQVNAQVPAGLAPGAVPVVLTIGGKSSSPATTMVVK